MNKLTLLLLLLMSVVLIPAARMDRDAVLEKPLWKQIYTEYSCDSGIIEILRSKTDRVTSIDVYFAFWCGDSENNVPPFIKVFEETGFPGIEVNYFIVDRKKPGEKFYFEKLNVERVPTFIFFKDGKEIGRIIENPKKSLEEDLLEIVF